ncbi:putative endo-beta-1,4-glucanase D [Hypsizygus marmoreus]|uniref:AA9 family lytic polysaccharide monooxygenase n=1 Tax=Hypsizygus marmoreus TaxID=39966 RepID=A0A369JGB4_HYPMA|nr:putative endo-beta-1,4-glucanase D [Hypsizygus marmoreus]
MRKASSIASLLLFFNSVSAHTIFQELWVNGVSQGHLSGIRVPDYDGPISDVNSNDIICNGGINPYHQPVSTKVIDVPAGAQVIAEWHHTLSSANTGDASDPIDASHHGPVLAYLAKVPSATQSSVTGLKWFKIYHDGLDSSGKWGVDKLITNKGKVTFTIPSCIAAGQYLLRVELIALHGAQSYPGAQFYMECAQLNIIGGGSTSPATVNFPGAYSGSDPGIKINIYQTLNSYTIPGPPVFSCNGQSNPGTTAAPAPTTAAPTTSAPPVPTTSALPVPTTSTAPSGPAVPHYGQCGGLTYAGSTVCESPFACVKSNDYYSQCL